jgi:DNA-directed RNA polymerase subunit RPC12/RpoP
MGVFNEIKEVISFLQKTDNIDMVNKVIEIQSNIISMQEELMSLRAENSKFKDDKKIEKKIKRFPKDTVFILSGNEDIMYCSKCWDDERKLIQVTRDDDYYKCPKCNNHNIFYEKSKYYHMLNQDNDSNIV